MATKKKGWVSARKYNALLNAARAMHDCIVTVDIQRIERHRANMLTDTEMYTTGLYRSLFDEDYRERFNAYYKKTK